MKKVFLFVFSILSIDQFLKIYIKTHFELEGGVSLLPFFRIFFVENPGMAYGINFGSGSYGKILLSTFRFILVIFIFLFLYVNLKKGSSKYLTIPTSLVFSGAMGNLLDSALYGLLFNTGTIYNQELKKWIPYHGISKINFNFFQKQSMGGYASLMEGCVVDMLSFPIINTYFPHWIPFFGGYNFQFFSPIFNFSDVMIFIGVFSLLVFRHKIKNVKIL
ncbi:lipoprotein signal peptidase [Blattabacterium cuenoti]|uniref:Lipoprotein signal peptidase n=1 Tax=Blattabacterium cuenoti STAT TaxID=1457030 RepID=A0A224AJR0_9FLAO|nr:lipoprotein signal peptidase [Blattabacterium cuenoti]BBA17381.1 lipoprotein signal peptidase [Blattabacterium cuenoti STAT]